jgi:hypothetical protein
MGIFYGRTEHMSDHEPTHLILHKGHFYHAQKGEESVARERGWWIGESGCGVCHIGKEVGCLPLDEARRLFEEETKREPTPPAPTREKAIEAMARGIDPKAWASPHSSLRQEYARMSATAAYDALLAMGAIREQRTVVEQINDLADAVMSNAK